MLEMDAVSLHDRVGLVLTDPTYNVRRESGRSEADYDRQTPDDMAKMTMLCKRVMKLGAREHIF